MTRARPCINSVGRLALGGPKHGAVVPCAVQREAVAPQTRDPET